MQNTVYSLIFAIAVVNCQKFHCTPPTILCNPPTKYRSFDGSCNNLQKPAMGMAKTTYPRLFSHNYRDGISLPQNNLPSARKICNEMFYDVKQESSLTQLFMSYGQIIAHDIMSSTPVNTPSCCPPVTRVNRLEDKCVRIKVTDPSDVLFGQRCISMERNMNTRMAECSKNRPAEQFNSATAALDCSDIYGISATIANSLRGPRGRLRTRIINKREYMPALLDGTYNIGDDRVSQNIPLGVLTTARYRLHNKIADALAIMNPIWSNDKLFLEARKIVMACHQHIIYNEWLPLLLGTKEMVINNLMSNSDGYGGCYSTREKLEVFNEFTIVLRVLHGLIESPFKMYNGPSVSIGEHLFEPAFGTKHDNFDKILMGMSEQPCRHMSAHFTKDITTFLNFTDLCALDVERGRDNGVPSYTKAMEDIFSIKITSFGQLGSLLDKERLETLRSLYNDVNKIDFVVGVFLENPEAGSRIGKTLREFLTMQFRAIKCGDRFWYENKGEFSRAQLKSIRQMTIANLLCIGSDNFLGIATTPFQKTRDYRRCGSFNEEFDMTPWQE